MKAQVRGSIWKQTKNLIYYTVHMDKIPSICVNWQLFLDIYPFMVNIRKKKQFLNSETDT